MKLSVRHRIWLYSVFGVLFATGLGWWLIHRTESAELQTGLEIRPVEPWLMKIHGAAAMLGLIILGALIPLHIKRSWRARRNRGSGSSMITVCILLIVTGYALYYAGGDHLRALASTAHLVLGLGFPVLLIWHIICGRRSARRASAPPSSDLKP
jgi:hypothetical protein